MTLTHASVNTLCVRSFLTLRENGFLRSRGSDDLGEALSLAIPEIVH